MITATWLGAAEAFREMSERVTSNGVTGAGFGEWVHPPVPRLVKSASIWLWGGGHEEPVDDDLLCPFWLVSPRRARTKLTLAAQICESLAYDGSDGP